MSMSPLLRSELFERHGASAVFSLRACGNLGYGLGDSDGQVDRHLEGFVQDAGLPQSPHQVRQVHGIGVLGCEGRGGMHAGEADILIAREPGCPVGVRVADCLSVLLVDPRVSIVAAVHAGWRGTVAGAVREAVEVMHRQGTDPANLIAVLAPCIGPCCFSIGEDVAEQLAGCCEGAAAHVRDGRADLAAINIAQLEAAGVGRAHIEHLGGCTCCDPERFFSYRRDGEGSGRHLAVAVLHRRP
ncbi:MAG TPA: peptidoglycan editing factor PgeF [Mariprofundaceae bacterium]|nr:peptidoglycan editing factor PgeF [Mariprofundaceae bacterium]